MRSCEKLQRHGFFAWALLALSAVLLLAALSGCQRGTETQSGSTEPQQTITADLTYAPNVPPPVTRTCPARVIVNLVSEEKTREHARVSVC